MCRTYPTLQLFASTKVFEKRPKRDAAGANKDEAGVEYSVEAITAVLNSLFDSDLLTNPKVCSMDTYMQQRCMRHRRHPAPRCVPWTC